MKDDITGKPVTENEKNAARDGVILFNTIGKIGKDVYGTVEKAGKAIGAGSSSGKPKTRSKESSMSSSVSLPSERKQK